MKKSITITTIVLLLSMFFSPGAWAATSGERNSGGESLLANISVPFVKNQGQIASKVFFYADTFYGAGYVTSDGITHRVRGEGHKILVFKERFLDADGNPVAFRPQGEDLSGATASFFKGKDRDSWRSGVPTFNVVNLGELYPGIVVKLRVTGGNMEKLFFVSPDADPDDVRIQILGADNLEIDDGSSLVIKSRGFQDILMSKPSAFQENNPDLEISYWLHGYTYGLRIGDYDHSRFLIIDAILGYGACFGGAGRDAGWDISVNSDGNTCITGYTWSADFPARTGIYEEGHLEGFDAFVAKLNPAGTELVYAAFLGGSRQDWGTGIAFDRDGTACITGYTESPDFPATEGACQGSHAGGFDAFVARLNPAGTELVYATFLGGSGQDWGTGIAVDADGNACITGYTESPDFPATEGACQGSHAGGFDAFVAKLNPAGTELVYTTFLGGSKYDCGKGIAVDGDGNACITGYTWSVDFPVTIGTCQEDHLGGFDAFVAKLNYDGTKLVYATFLGGTGDDEGHDIALDGDGNVCITGVTRSVDFPATERACQISHLGGFDAFVAKLNYDGTKLVYATFLGGAGNDYGRGIAADVFGNVFITGDTNSTDFYVTEGALQGSHAGGFDAFVAELDPDGTELAYATFLGGTAPEYGFKIASDERGFACITGYTESCDFPSTDGIYTGGIAGGGDAFFAKFELFTVNPW